jgi:hypothetical protein
MFSATHCVRVHVKVETNGSVPDDSENALRIIFNVSAVDERAPLQEFMYLHLSH